MTDSQSSVIRRRDNTGILLRPTPATPPLGVRLYKPDPPNLPEYKNSRRRLPFWQPDEA